MLLFVVIFGIFLFFKIVRIEEGRIELVYLILRSIFFKKVKIFGKFWKFNLFISNKI